MLAYKGHCDCREVFPSGETDWEDDKNLLHKLGLEILGKVLLLLKQTSEKYGEYRVGLHKHCCAPAVEYLVSPTRTIL